MSGPRFLPTCEICEDCTVPLPRHGRMGRRPCGACPGMHAVCPDCAKEWNLIGDYYGKDPWAVCSDAVKVALELMRPEGGEPPSTFEEMQRRLQDYMTQTEGIKMQDFTQSSLAQVLLKVQALAADTMSEHLDQAANEMFGDLKTDDDQKDQA